MHGTSGTTGSEDCLLLYSVVGNSLIFPISFALLAKFEAGKPGGESVSASVCTDALTVFSVSVLLHSRTLAEFSGQSGSPAVHRCVPTHCRCFPRNPGGESGGVVLYSAALPAFSGIKPKGWYAAEVLWK